MWACSHTPLVIHDPTHLRTGCKVSGGYRVYIATAVHNNPPSPPLTPSLSLPPMFLFDFGLLNVFTHWAEGPSRPHHTSSRHKWSNIY